MAFDLAKKLQAVSNLNSQEQIEYLPIELLNRDPDNFYSLDGIEELADSIATVGILTPLRVRQNSERYTITSGHRRRAAVQLLIDSGEDWSRGLPCIVDRGEETPEWSELKLIFANRQRVKSSAELSREAARTDELFCALKEKGYEFPGRMQEHVAAALGVKASKLKRLHAIRANLIPELLTLYDANTINEETAYQLQQLPEGVQRYLSAQKKVKAGILTGAGAKICVERCEKYLQPPCKCPDGSNCTHTYPRFYQTLTADAGWCRCPTGECCLKCNRGVSDCPYRCKRSKDALAQKKEAEKAEKASTAERLKRELDANRDKLGEQYKRLAALAEAAGLDGSEALYIDCATTVADLMAVAADPSLISNYKARDERVFSNYTLVRTVEGVADKLGVSVDYLLGRTETPGVTQGSPAASDSSLTEAAKWSRGTPTEEGWYACLGSWAGIPERIIAYWRDGAWYEEKRSRRIMSDTEITEFYRLPDVEEAPQP